jgi:hypothetical protein
MKTQDGEWITSTAHDFHQALPLSDGVLVCVRCGTRTPIKSIPDGGCTVHWESADSGFAESE